MEVTFDPPSAYTYKRLSPAATAQFYHTMKRVIVRIRVLKPDRPPGRGVGKVRKLPEVNGTGVLVNSKGYVLTALHVICEPEETSDNTTVTVSYFDHSLGSKLYEEVDRDAAMDLILLKPDEDMITDDVEENEFDYATFRDDTPVDAGMQGFLISNTRQYVYSLHIGEICFPEVAPVPSNNSWIPRSRMYNNIPVLQMVNFHTNQCASGAPLLDMNGRIFGIHNCGNDYTENAIQLKVIKALCERHLS